MMETATERQRSTAMSRQDLKERDLAFPQPTSVQERICERLLEIFPNGCRRVLLVTPPESPEQHFNIDLVRSKRYPCFPPYGPGILARNLESRGYRGALLDL